MLHDLRIQNFKIWHDTDEFRLAPLTLFFGSNSSGKSSISQFLMMLKQTAASQDRSAVCYPGDQNSIIDLGSFQDMIHKHDENRSLCFSYTWDLETPLNIKDTVHDVRYKTDCIKFDSEIKLDGDLIKTPTVMSMNYSLYQFDENYTFQFGIGMQRNKNSKKGAYSVQTNEYKSVRQKGRPWAPGAPIKFYGFPDEVASYHQNTDFTKDLNLEHEKLFRSMFYLGPIRESSDRLYKWSGTKPESVGFKGEKAISALLAAQNRRFNFAPREHTKPFGEVIARKLRQMGLIKKFKINKISPNRQEYEVKVQTIGSNSFVDLPDVGFGISQVLPVLIQLFYAPVGSIIIMEQPEIHLHPRAQSELADIMIEAIHSRENAEHRNIQLIIETHSEHFLRRIQRRLAEDVLNPKEVAAYFSNSTRTPVALESLKIDEYGNISNWPKDFFGDEMGDVVARANAALKKKIAE